MTLPKFINKENRTYLYFYLLALLIHFFLPINWADDAIFINKSSQLTWLEFVSNSARPLVDSLTYFFSRYPLAWRVLNPFILIVLALILSKFLYVGNNTKMKVAICIAIIYPAMIVVDAGFIATTLNYLWTVTFGLLCLLPLWKTINNIEVKLYEKILLLPFLFYATNMQQMAVVLVVIFLIGYVYSTKKKKNRIYTLLQLIISVLCTLFSFFINTFGDNSRMIRETGRYFPDFSGLNLFEKFELGFSSTFYCLIMELHFGWIAFTIFTIFLVYLVFKNSKKAVDRLQVCFPLLCSSYGLLRTLFSSVFLVLENYIPGDVKNYKMTKATYSFELFADLVYLLIIVCILYSLWILLKNMVKYLIATSIFFIGLGTRILMGFSPTVWASGHRTFFIMFLSLIMIVIIIVNDSFDYLKYISNPLKQASL